MKIDLDLLIVGHGITGANLHLHARQRGLSCAVFDLPKKNESSSVAVGLFHPMAFRDSKYAWAGKEVFDEALDFYRSIDEDKTLVQDIILYRILGSTEEYNRWRARMEESQYLDVLDYSSGMEVVEAPHGLGKLKACAKLDVPAFIAKSRELLADDHYFETEFDFDAFDEETGGYKSPSIDFQAKHIVFCEGLGIQKNPFFSHLPFHPAKGDLLKIRLGNKLNAALNKKHFIAPSEDGLYWLGATYDNKNLRVEPDEKAAQQLLEVARSIYTDKLVPLEHLAGIRPASYDRRPFVGTHPHKSKVSVLNGMGSKACLLSPRCSALLLDALLKEENIPAEMALERVDSYLKKKAH